MRKTRLEAIALILQREREKIEELSHNELINLSLSVHRDYLDELDDKQLQSQLESVVGQKCKIVV